MIFVRKSIDYRKIVCAIMMMFMIVSISGCRVEKQKVEKKNVESSKEKYVRYNLDLDEDPLAFSKAEAGGVFVVTGNEKISKNVWYIDSNDNKNKVYDLYDILDIDKNVYCNAFVSADCDLFVEVNEGIDITKGSPFSGGKLEYFIIDKSGNRKNIDISLPALKHDLEQDEEHNENNEVILNHIITAKYFDGNFYVLDANSNVYEIDLEKNVSKCVFNNDMGHISDFCIYDRTLIMWIEEDMCIEGLDTHVHEKEMGDRLFDFFEEAKYSMKPIKIDVDNNILWTVSEDRICKLDLENNETVKYKAFGTNSNEYVVNQVTTNNEMYALVKTFDNQKSRLYKYSISDDVSTVSDAQPEKLKIWILEGSSSLDESVRIFTDQYPNVEVEIESGLGEFDSGLTTSDAIKNLNTSLLSGNGPDIIYMDGLDLDKYVSSSELYSLKDLVNELESSGEYFNNILETFTVDGDVYAIPSSVTLIGKVGTTEELKASENLRDFVDYTKSHSGENIGIHKDLVTNYILNIYYKDIQSFIVNGEIEREALKEYYGLSKELFDIAGNKERELDTYYMYDPANYAGGYDGSFDFVFGNRFDVAFVSSYEDMAKKIGGEVEFPANDYRDQYIVRGCMAISSKSSNVNAAKDYIKVVLGDKCQSGLGSVIGFGVNKKGLEEYNRYINKLMMQSHEEDGENVDSANEELDKRIEDIINHLEKVNKPMHINNLLDQIVFDEMNGYIQGKTDLDTAVDKTFEKLDLYLSE